MKKQLLSIFAAVSVGAMFAQVPSADWSTNQNAVFPAPASVSFKGVKFMDAVDANVVWVTGWDLAAPRRNYNWYSRTTDGGATFAGGNIFSDTNTYVIANMEAIDANTAWVCSYMKGIQGMGAIHRTNDGGATWVNMTATGMYTSTTESFANWVTFLTPQIGVANGDPVNGVFELWRTTDGGLTWNRVPSSNIPAPLSANEFAIVDLYAKVGSSHLWFGTNGNRMFRSTDAGLTYSVSAFGPATNTITEIAFASPMDGICFMVNASLNLELWNTTDGGVNWSQVSPLPANLGFADIGAIPGTGHFVSYGSGTGNEIISYSADNGATWTDWGSTGIPYITGDFVDGNTGWAGSLDFQGFTDVWKYSGAGISGTVIPTAAFYIPTTLCFGGSSETVTVVNNSTGSPALTYSWTVLPGGTLSSATASNPTITFNATGSYTVILEATNAVGVHTSAAVIDLITCTAPVASFSLPASACSNFSFATSNSSSGSPAPSYQWSVTPATGVTISPSPVNENPSILVGTPGIYSVTLLASNAAGTSQTTHTLNVASCPPTASFALTFSCDAAHGFSTTSSASNPPGTSGSISYTWSILPSAGVTYSPNLFSPNVRARLGLNPSGDYTITARVRNASGTATVSQVITPDMYYCDGVGIAENSFLANNLSVYPNPAHEQLNISLPGVTANSGYKVRLTNVLGAVVFEDKSKRTTETAVVNLANQPKGVYFLTVEFNNEKITKKIVVE